MRNEKKCLRDLPTSTSPNTGETLTIYLSASQEVISVRLLAEREKKNILVYFISRVLQGAEKNYSIAEKLVLSLVYVARWLRWYFLAHPILLITNQPMKQIMMQPERSGCIMN